MDRCCCFVSIQVGANTNVQKPREPVASVSISRPSATANQQLKPAPDRRLRSASVKPTSSSTRQQVLLLSSHTHTDPFNGPLSGTTQVSWYQKGTINLDFTEAGDSEWQRHQLGRITHMQVCTSLQRDNHASTPPLSFFTGRMPFLPPNQQQTRFWAMC